jgi:pectate lyase
MKCAVFCFPAFLLAFFLAACEADSLPAKNNSPAYVSAVAIQGGNFILAAGQTKTLEVSVGPEKAAEKRLEFSSTDPAVAEVDAAEGVVSAVAAGTAYIRATAIDGSGVSDTVKVTVVRGDPEEPSVLWDWRGGDGYESGQLVRGKQALTLDGDVSVNAVGNLVLRNGGRFTIGTADPAPTTSAASGGYMAADGAFDFSRRARVTVTFTSATGNFNIFVNNNTTSAGNSVLGSSSRIYNNSPAAGRLEALVDPAYLGGNHPSLEKAFLQFRISGSGSAITVSGITVTYEEEENPVDPEDLIVQSIIISGGDFTLSAGQSKQLSYTVLPETALNKQLSWSSSDGAVASVSSAYVQALIPGTAWITAAAQDGSGISDSVRVTVTGSAGDSPQAAAAQIFAALKGRAALTSGWADRYNGGSGVQYASPANYTLVDDGTYPSVSAKLTAFKNALANTAASFIVISGDIDLSNGKITDADHSYFEEFDPVTGNRLHGDITENITSNTTIIGINNARIKYGGLRINNRVNVIIRNLTFWDAHGSTEKDTSKPENADSKASIDALVIQGSSDGVWVDHCTFTDGLCEDLTRNYNHDGALDIPKGKNITISWCEFTNHDKVMLVASSDSAANAVPEDRQITLHHNYFHDKVTQRMPRSRGTQMHIYNNYYNNIGVSGNAGYSLGPGYGSQFIVENNYFGAHTALNGAGIVKYFDPSENSLSSTFSRFYQSGNIPVLADANCSYDGVDRLKSFISHLSAAKPWAIPYAYSLENAAGLTVSVPAGAGSGLEARELLE